MAEQGTAEELKDQQGSEESAIPAEGAEQEAAAKEGEGEAELSDEEKAAQAAAEAEAEASKEKKFTDADMKDTRIKYQKESQRERDARIAAETEARIYKELLLSGKKLPEGGTTEPVVQADKPQELVKPTRPVESTFETHEEFMAAMDKYEDESYAYRKAVDEQKRAQEEASTKKKESQTAIQKSVTAAVEAGRKAYADFDEVVINNPTMIATPMITAAIVKMPNAADVTYYLGKNAEENKKLAGMSDPIDLAIAVREISDKLKVTKKPVATKTGAPKPAATVAGKTAASTDSNLEGKSKEERIRLLEEASRKRRLASAGK